MRGFKLFMGIKTVLLLCQMSVLNWMVRARIVNMKLDMKGVGRYEIKLIN